LVRRKTKYDKKSGESMKKALIIVNLLNLPLGIYLLYVIVTGTSFNVTLLLVFIALGVIGFFIFGREINKKNS
jgi:hypothetical protein